MFILVPLPQPPIFKLVFFFIFFYIYIILMSIRAQIYYMHGRSTAVNESLVGGLSDDNTLTCHNNSVGHNNNNVGHHKDVGHDYDVA